MLRSESWNNTITLRNSLYFPSVSAWQIRTASTCSNSPLFPEIFAWTTFLLQSCLSFVTSGTRFLSSYADWHFVDSFQVELETFLWYRIQCNSVILFSRYRNLCYSKTVNWHFVYLNIRVSLRFSFADFSGRAVRCSLLMPQYLLKIIFCAVAFDVQFWLCSVVYISFWKRVRSV